MPYCKFASCRPSKKGRGLGLRSVTDAEEANKWSKLFMSSILVAFATIKYISVSFSGGALIERGIVFEIG